MFWALAVRLIELHSRATFLCSLGMNFWGVSALGEATDTQEQGKTTLEDKSISLYYGLHKGSYGPCCLLSQHSESTHADSNWSPGGYSVITSYKDNLRPLYVQETGVLTRGYNHGHLPVIETISMGNSYMTKGFWKALNHNGVAGMCIPEHLCSAQG